MPIDKKQRLDRLARRIQRCRRCALHRRRTQAVPGEGPADPAGMLIGEAPGQEEDRTGLPFKGRTGAFLDTSFAATGVQRKILFITSAVKCRPPKNRDPKREELSMCHACWLEKQIALVDPPVVLILGRIAALQTFHTTEPLRDVRGVWREMDGRKWLITYHPTAAMRFPECRKQFHSDLLLFAATL